MKNNLNKMLSGLTNDYGIEYNIQTSIDIENNNKCHDVIFKMNGYGIRDRVYKDETYHSLKNIVDYNYKKLLSAIIYKAIDIANIIINKQNKNGNNINNLQLNKLLFYCQKYYIKTFNSIMFKDNIELNEYGFTVPEVYHTYKINSTLNIYDIFIQGKVIKVDKYTESIIDSVLSVLSNKTAMELVELNMFEKLYIENKDKLTNLKSIILSPDDMIKWYKNN